MLGLHQARVLGLPGHSMEVGADGGHGPGGPKILQEVGGVGPRMFCIVKILVGWLELKWVQARRSEGGVEGQVGWLKWG